MAPCALSNAQCPPIQYPLAHHHHHVTSILLPRLGGPIAWLYKMESGILMRLLVNLPVLNPPIHLLFLGVPVPPVSEPPQGSAMKIKLLLD